MGFLSPHYNYNSYPSQTFQTTNNSETITFQHQHHEQEQLFQLSQQNLDFDFCSSYLDQDLIFPTPDPYFYSHETYLSQDQLLIDSTFSLNQNDGFVSLNEIFPPNEEDFNNYLPCAKRQKLCYEEKIEQQQQQHEQEHLNSANFFVDEFMTNPFSSFEAQQFSSSNIVDGVDVVQCEKKISERTISTQSIAARERRRKITEKTQELGKLVPGGPKMNTAEMLNAAASYVKFLQAQVGMLQVMETFSKEEKEPPPSEDLQKLIISPSVQEKLYSEQKCFVPKAIITTLTNHVDVRSKPSILQGLTQLVGTEIDHEKKPKQE